MFGPAIHDESVDRSGAIAMQEGGVGPVGLCQLVIKEGGVAHAVQLILLPQEAVPDGIPFRPEPGDRFECAVAYARPRAPQRVRHRDERSERGRLVPVGQRLAGRKEPRVVVVGVPDDLMAAAAVGRLDRRDHAHGAVLQAGRVFAGLQQLPPGCLAGGVVGHVEDQRDPPPDLHGRPAVGIPELVRHLADLPDHLAVGQGQVARTTLPVVERPLTQLGVIGAPLFHHRQGRGEILFVKRDDFDGHRYGWAFSFRMRSIVRCRLSTSSRMPATSSPTKPKPNSAMPEITSTMIKSSSGRKPTCGGPKRR